MRSLVIAALATLALASYGAENSRPIGPNCALDAPPAEAGEESNRGMIMRVFPRAKDIGADYSGCHAVFIEDHGKWVVWFLVEIASGYPLRVWSEHGSDDPVFSCRYLKGKLVQGDPDSCPSGQMLLVKSMPHGCLDLLQGWLARLGPTTPRPAHCAYE